MPAVGTTHHIQLGGHYYMLKPGSYMKRVAPQFGARFTTGDPDYNNLSFWQHWSQRCFVGGMDAPDFADDAMYDDGVGVNTSEHERVTLARDLKKGPGANWSLGGTAVERRFIVYNNKLLCATFDGTSRLYQWDASTDGWTQITIPSFTLRSVGTFGGKLFIGGVGGGSAKLYYSSGALSSWTQITNPAGIPGNIAVYAMRSFQQRLYVAFGTHVWRLKTDLTWDGNTVFYQADQNSESNYIRAMEVHLGFLYMLSGNGHIHRTDGNTTFDIWNWDGGTLGVSIKSFDGRLFVATYEYDDGAANYQDEGFGVLYQMSGSAMTQLKRWGKVGEATMLGNMIVHDRRLFYGASNLLGLQRGFGVAVYDPVEDAHTIFASNSDTTTYNAGSAPYTNFAVDDVIFFSNRIWVSVRGHGVFFVRYSWRDVRRLEADFDTTSAGVQVGPKNGGWFTTSTYDAGTPGLRKLWRKIVVDYELPDSSTSLVVEYSLDNGSTWTTAMTVTTASATGRVRKECFLENKISVSLKLRFTLRSTNSIWTPVFYGFVVSYLPIVEPNWLWTFTIVLAEKIVLLDGTEEVVDTEAELAFLRDTYRTKQLVNFIDADNTAWASGGQPGVLIYDIDFRLYSLTRPLEGEVTVTLLEAVETY